MRNRTDIFKAAEAAPSCDEIVQAIKQKWQEIGYDILDAAPENRMSGEEVREVVSDYITVKGWWDLPFKQRDKLLAQALPFQSYCA